MIRGESKYCLGPLPPPHKTQLVSLPSPVLDQRNQGLEEEAGTYLKSLLKKPQSSLSLATSGNSSDQLVDTQAIISSQEEPGEASWERGHWIWGFVGV